ncbi:MAG: alpha/beta fold hydrolase [Microbacteriaceae bacterium]|nr:alpha/beta fold hydrolase [Microbacteriaceae bacterium]
MTVLLLHPIGLDRSTWQGVPIEDSIAIDLPGHGDAPLGSVATLADVADAALEALQDRRPVDVVGVSLGGMVALHMALRHPDRVRSLVVACAPAATAPDAMLGRAEDTERLGMDGLMDVTLRRWFSQGALIDDRPVVRAAAERLAADDPTAIARYWRMLAGHDLRARLGEIAVPVTVVAGTGDVSVTPAIARELEDGIADARLVELDGPHMLHLEAPEAFAAAVREHLARQLG